MSSKLLQLIIQLKDEASAGLNSLRGSLDSIGGIASGALLGGIAAASAAVVGLGASSLQVAADFEAATATFASVAGGALQQAGFSLDDVKNKALELGAVTQFSAAAAQEAMINLAKGGVPVADIMGKATDATLALAAAGEVELASAADIVAKQLGVWGDQGVTAAQVADTLAQAANASTVDVEELALGLANVGGVAKASGMSFADLNQTMAMIAPGFSSAADAGTSLKTMILGLQPSTGPAIESFRQLGLMQFNTSKAMDALRKEGIEPVSSSTNDLVTQIAQLGASYGYSGDKLAQFVSSFETSKFYDQQGAFIGMDQAAALLQQSLGGLSEAEQSAALKTMFGTDAFRAASIVVNQGAAGFQAMGAAMDAAGTAAEQAAIRNATFKFAWDSLLGTIETIQIVIGSALLPVLTALVNNAIIPAANAVLTFIQSILAADDPILAVTTAISGLQPVLGSFAPILANLIGYFAVLVTEGDAANDFFANLPGPVQTLVSAFLGLVSAVQPLLDLLGANLMTILGGLAALVGVALVGAFVSFAAALVAAAAPFAVLIAVAAALYAAWVNDFGGLQTLVMSALGSVLSIVSSVAGSIVAIWQQNGAQIVASAQATFGAVVSTISGVLSGVLSVVAAVLAQVAAFWQANGTQIVATASQIWMQVGAIVQTAMQLIQATVIPILTAVAAFIVAHGAQIQGALAGAWQIISSIIQAALALIMGIIKATLQIVQGDFSGAWATIQQAAAAFVSGLIGVLQGAVGLLSNVGRMMGDALASAWKSFTDWSGLGGSVIDGIIKGIGSAVGRLASAAANAAKSALDAAKKALGIASPSKVMADQVGVQIPAGVADGISKATPKAASAMTDMAGKLVALVSNATGAFGQLANIGTIPAGAVARFSESMLTVVAMLDAVNQVTRGKMMASATQITGGANKVLETIVKGVDGFAKLATMGEVPLKAIDLFGSALYSIIVELDTINVATRGPMMASATQITGGAQKVVEMVGKGVEAFTGLSKMGTVTPAHAHMFAAALYSVIVELQTVAQAVSGSGLVLAQTLAESAIKIVAVIGTGVDNLNKLRTFAAPAQSAIDAFGVSLSAAVVELLRVATVFAGQSFDAAIKFSDSVQKIMALVGTAADSLSKLVDFAVVSEGSINNFAQAVYRTVQVLSNVAVQFAAEGLARAASFSEAAGKILSIISNGVQGFVALASLGPVSEGSINNFAQATFRTVQVLGNVAVQFAAEGLAHAAVFADAAGKVLAIVGNGVDGLSKLADLGPVSDTAIANFAQAIFVTMQRLANAAANFSAEAITHAGVFADSAGKAVGILKSGVEGLLLVDTFAGVSSDAIDRFGEGVRLAVAKMAALAVQFGTEAIAAASSFAAAAGDSTDFLKKGVDGFDKLADLKDVSQQSLDQFSAAVVALINTIIQLSTVLSTDVLLQANTFAKSIDSVITIIKGGLDSLSKMGEQTGDITAFTTILVSSIDRLAAALVKEAQPASISIGENIAIGIAVGIQQGVPAIVNATYDAVNAAIIAARQALGIASPSKVFDEIGQLSGAGLAGGLDASQANVSAAADQLANATIAPVVAAPATTAAIAPRVVGGGGSSSSSSLTIEKGAITIIQQKNDSDDALARRLMAMIEKKYKDKLG